MIRGTHPRVAWVLAAVWFLAGVLAIAQPRRPQGNRANAPAATEEVSIPTVPTVAANVCIADDARTRATECPAGATHFGTHASTGLPGAVQRTEENKNKNKTKEARAPGTRIGTRDILRQRQIQERSEQLLLNEIRLTATLVRNMRANDANRPPALMRLAEDYQELLTGKNGAAEELEEEIFTARRAHNDAQVATLEQRQATLRQEGAGYREQLIRTFQVLVESAPNYEHMDQALFYLGFALQDANRHDEALRVYRTMIQRFPQSPYVPNAYLSFAEHYFDTGEMENAKLFYERVLAVQDENNQVFGYATYKMAWVLYNLNDYEGSLQKFFEVIEYGRQHPNAPSVRSLLGNARMELVSVYAQVYGNAQHPLNPTNALNTFRRYAADEGNAYDMFEKLAELYHDNGQWPNSIAMYHTLMEARSSDDKICFWQSQVARAVVASRPKPEQMTEVQRLVDMYNTFRNSQRTAEVKSACRNHAARVTFDVASHWHLEAIGRSAEGAVQTRGTRDRNTMRMVGELYQKILDEFPDFDTVEFPEYQRNDWPTRYRIAYYRADMLRDMENFQDCGPAYDAVVEMRPDGEYTEDAAYKAVLCYNALFARSLNEEATHRGDRGAARTAQSNTQRNMTDAQRRAQERIRMVPRDLNRQEEGMLRAFTRYVCFVQNAPAGQAAPQLEGQDPRTVMITIKYRRAYLYYNANHFEEASTIFRDIANSPADTPDPENLREISADLYLDALNVMGSMWNPVRPACFDSMGEEVPRFVASFCSAAARSQHEDFCHRMEELQCQILRKKAEALATSGRHGEASAEYIRIVRTHRECGRLDEMLYNGAIESDAAFQLGRSMRIRERLVQIFLPRNSTWAQRALYRLAGNYHAIQVFRRAADLYEQYADYVQSHRQEAIANAREAARVTHAAEEDPVAQAADALRQATIFRIGLGEEQHALDNAQKFARYFGSDPSRRRDAANVVFSIGQIYTDRVARLKRRPVSGDTERRQRDLEIRTAWNDVVRHYSGFMRAYAAQGTLDQKIQGAVALARGYWNLNDERQSSQYFNQAVTLWTAGEGGGEATIRRELGESGAADAIDKSKESVAEARFFLAEVIYQRFRARRLPIYHGSSSATAYNNWATRTLSPFIREQDRFLREDATRQYTEVVNMHVPNWEVAAYARLGDMFYQFAVYIRTAPPPPDVARNAELLDAYNVLRDENTQRFVNVATEGFRRCITTSTTVHWFNDWTQLCERELNEIDRARYPVADEVRVEPNLVFSRPTDSRAVYSLQTSAEAADEESQGATPGTETATPGAN
jgi:tetratricopeptide (TPR) repeat protein